MDDSICNSSPVDRPGTGLGRQRRTRRRGADNCLVGAKGSVQKEKLNALPTE
jgi:hypothetical protein